MFVQCRLKFRPENLTLVSYSPLVSSTNTAAHDVESYSGDDSRMLPSNGPTCTVDVISRHGFLLTSDYISGYLNRPYQPCAPYSSVPRPPHLMIPELPMTYRNPPDRDSGLETSS